MLGIKRPFETQPLPKVDTSKTVKLEVQNNNQQTARIETKKPRALVSFDSISADIQEKINNPTGQIDREYINGIMSVMKNTDLLSASQKNELAKLLNELVLANRKISDQKVAEARKRLDEHNQKLSNRSNS